MKQIKKPQGGARKNAGAPTKFNEETIYRNFLMPKSKADEISKRFYFILESYKTKP